MYSSLDIGMSNKDPIPALNTGLMKSGGGLRDLTVKFLKVTLSSEEMGAVCDVFGNRETRFWIGI